MRLGSRCLHQKFPRIILVLLLLFPLQACSDTNNSNPTGNNNNTPIEVTIPYLGAAPPEAIPQAFAPDVFDGMQLHSAIVVSADGTDIFYTSMDGPGGLSRRHFSQRGWSISYRPHFAQTYSCQDPNFSPDGNQLFFMVVHSTSNTFGNEYIAFVEKQGYNGEGNALWGEVQTLPLDLSGLDAHWGASISTNKTVYFGASSQENQPPDIYCAYWDGNNYTVPTPLSSAINVNSTGEDTPFVASDESYLLFTRTSANWMEKDLYISFKNQNGEWDEAIRLPYPINTVAHELSPNISPDEKYLFFLREVYDQVKPYWVNTSFLEKLQPE